MLVHVGYTCIILFHTGWIETLGGSDVRRLSQLVFCRLTSNSDQISLAINITEDFSWSLQLHGRSIEPHACRILSAVPQRLVSAELVGQLTYQLEQSSICPGNPDEKCFSLAASRKGIFMSHSGRCACRSRQPFQSPSHPSLNTCRSQLHNLSLISIIYLTHLDLPTPTQPTPDPMIFL